MWIWNCHFADLTEYTDSFPLRSCVTEKAGKSIQTLRETTIELYWICLKKNSAMGIVWYCNVLYSQIWWLITSFFPKKMLKTASPMVGRTHICPNHIAVSVSSSPLHPDPYENLWRGWCCNMWWLYRLQTYFGCSIHHITGFPKVMEVPP